MFVKSFQMTAEKFAHHSVVIEIIKKGGDMKTHLGELICQ